MDQSLMDYYYQFHKHQHYFLCHDILEDAWKSQNTFSKHDAVVSLILFATANYHYRRGNLKGALKSFEKALLTINHAKDDTQLHLNINEFKQLIVKMIEAVKLQKQFTPLQLPIEPEFQTLIKRKYPDYLFTSQIIKEPYIVDHHIKRDRTEVIKNRERALFHRQYRNKTNKKDQ
ncbi:DUF309 domain-containing protein [Staphylococcus epidermidis]|uniref:DUF309 domain-containing protein n=1 Tax=Staphylococcus epidermidis TaxID=1282 RepID=UPI0003192F76|nr:DUF309 domain-containing protein [Staphylococcus epidermidis]MBF9299118.1 DUF309 domain-containing protein [Staphylococcus schleiferi]MBE7318019.1 DUF309 domain-containing protein [Staphylococcus epidermidis]MBE7348007.1 DUF309 domain-containing protein [Staphylococcus epidermidis]MBE7359092.1 DUF309 domain-containing protein [Staphylococcus epidermidis]MBE9438953.1 DUF309 domain-containing protein [Staphylococcus epidermidis]